MPPSKSVMRCLFKYFILFKGNVLRIHYNGLAGLLMCNVVNPQNKKKRIGQTFASPVIYSKNNEGCS